MLSRDMGRFFIQSVADSKTLPKDATTDELVAASAGYIGLAVGKVRLDDDMLQDYLAHLCHAATMFDPSKSKWGTYATNVTMRYHWQRMAKKRFSALNLNESAEHMMAQRKDDGQSSPLDNVIADELSEYLGGFVEKLPYDQRTVISLRYGLDGNRPHNRREIGEIMDVSKEWVRLLEHKALEQMRKMMAV